MAGVSILPIHTKVEPTGRTYSQTSISAGNLRGEATNEKGEDVNSLCARHDPGTKDVLPLDTGKLPKRPILTRST